MAFARDWVSGFLLVAALGCFVASGFPSWSERVDPESGDQFREIRLGLGFSPLAEHTRRTYDRFQEWNDVDGFGESHDFRQETQLSVNVLSWSFLAFLVGVVLLVIFRRRRRALADR
jgi:hypothetical protein